MVTVALGIGINKPDVRLVIHYGVPKDMGRYYLEMGQAGRDHQPAKCVLLHSEDDIEQQIFLRSVSGLEDKVNKHMGIMLDDMEKFLYSDECRRLVDNMKPRNEQHLYLFTFI